MVGKPEVEPLCLIFGSDDCGPCGGASLNPLNADRLNLIIDTGEQLHPQGLSECEPEPVVVSNNELTHTIEGVIRLQNDLHLVFEALIQAINIIYGYVQVDLSTVLHAGFPACIEHDFAVSE